MIDVEGLEPRSVDPKRKRRIRILTIASIAVAIIVMTAVVIVALAPADHPGDKAVLRATDLNSIQFMNITGWEQQPISVVDYSSHRAEYSTPITTTDPVSGIDWSTSYMHFQNSTVNVTIYSWVYWSSSTDNAKAYFNEEVQRQQVGSFTIWTNMTNINGILGSYNATAATEHLSEQGFNASSDAPTISQSAIFYNGGTMVCQIYMTSADLTIGDYSLLSELVEMQIKRI